VSAADCKKRCKRTRDMFPLSYLSAIGPGGGGNGRQAELMRRHAAVGIGRGKRRSLHKEIEAYQRYGPPLLSFGYRPRRWRERAAGRIDVPLNKPQESGAVPG
jgi:hypothetical protein